MPGMLDQGQHGTRVHHGSGGWCHAIGHVVRPHHQGTTGCELAFATSQEIHTADQIAARVNRHARGVVPASRLEHDELALNVAIKEWIGLAAYFFTGRTPSMLPETCSPG